MMSKQNQTDEQAEAAVDPALLEQIGEYIDALPARDGVLIEVLHHAQGLVGYLPRDVQIYIARRLNLPGAEVFGVVSFYSFFTMEPPGKHIVSVCMGTACFVRGAEKILVLLRERLGIGANGTTEDNLFTLKDVRCVGACGLAPVVMVDDKVYGRVTEEDADKILADYNATLPLKP